MTAVDSNKNGATPIPAFSRMLKELRMDRELSQAGLAKRAGVSNGYIGLIEVGQRGERPSLDVVKRLGQALSASLDEMEILLRTTGYLGPHEQLVPDERPTFAQFVDSDPLLSRRQKDALLTIYESWVA